MTKQETVRVYTKPNCKQCDLTKQALTDSGIPFEVGDLTDPLTLEAAKALGYSSAPVVIVGEEGWAGFRPDLIQQLAKRAILPSDATWRPAIARAAEG